MLRRGFTLIELLIAAVIIGTLAILAMRSFTVATSDIRVEDIKARASIVATSAQRYLQDHPSAVFNGTVMKQVNFANPENCGDVPAGGVVLQNLVDCGYLEQRQYAREVARDSGVLGTHFQLVFRLSTSGVKRVWVCISSDDPKIISMSGLGSRNCTDGERWASAPE